MPAKRRSPNKRSLIKRSSVNRASVNRASVNRAKSSQVVSRFHQNSGLKNLPALHGVDPGAPSAAASDRKETAPGRRTRKRALSINQTLFLTASICAISTMAPQYVVAQALPTGCIDPAPADEDGIADATETIYCVSVTEINSPISTTVDDITVIVGLAAVETDVLNTSGVAVSAKGGGDQTIKIYNADSDITGSTNGVYGYVSSGGGDLSIYSAGFITGGNNGIYARNFGNGATTITTAGVKGTSADGINVFADSNTTNMIIDTSAGDVYGGVNGIVASHAGSGYVKITTANVNGVTGKGIYVFANSNVTDVTINTTAGSDVYGGTYGIDVDHHGSGAVSVTTDRVFGFSADGISVYADDSTTNVTIDTSADYVYGYNTGIEVDHNGSGYVSITTAEVVGKNRDGINVYAESTTTDVTINTTASATGSVNKEVYGGIDGIDVYHKGSGYVDITTADVTGKTGIGIDVDTEASTTNVIIDSSAGYVYGHIAGIDVDHDGSGYVDITTANVTGYNADGIDVTTSATVTSLTIDTTASNDVDKNVYGYDTAIKVFHSGSGDVSITTGEVFARNDDGIYLRANNSGANATINTTATNDVDGKVYGKDHGIYVEAKNSGGDVSITTADVTGNTEMGIRIVNTGYAVDKKIDSTAGKVTGGKSGIVVENLASAGSNYISIYTADVTGRADYGIYVFAGAGVSDVTINTTASSDEVYGYNTGILVSHNGSGSLSITTADVYGATDYGIYAYTDASTTNVTIDTTEGDVYGYDDGIKVRHNGSGSLSIKTADIRTEAYDGIEVVTGSNVGNVIINTTAGHVDGYYDGVTVEHNGTGYVSITTATLKTGLYDGVDVTTGNNVTGVTVNTTASSDTGGKFDAYDDGIYVDHDGSGDVSITTADLYARHDNGIAVYADPSTANVIIDTTAGYLYGGDFGIVVDHDGSGYVDIKTADIESGTFDGISVETATNTTRVTINTTAGYVDGDDTGIHVDHLGTGDVTITTADVRGDSDRGIDVYTDASTSGVTVNSSAGAVYGATRGIEINHFGSGAVSLTTADVTSGSNRGIDVYSAGAGITVDTTAGWIRGAGRGIDVDHSGSGAVYIATANVTGTSGAGIDVLGGVGSVGDITVNSAAGAVESGTYGINVLHYGAGAISITTADVTGNAGQGVFAYGGSSTTGTTIDTSAGAVTGGSYGMAIFHYGSGALSITTANVTGNNGGGIYAIGSALFPPINVTDVIVDTSAGAVVGATSGIMVANTGSGVLSVTAADVTGNNGDGIYASHSSGAVSFDLSGAVYGRGYGIRSYGPGGVSMTLSSGASVSGGIAAINISSSSNDTLTLGVGSSITGDAFLNDGDDTLNINGASFTGIFGGEGTDTANFGDTGNDDSTLEIASSALQEFEFFNFNGGGYELTGDHIGLTETNFNAGVNVLDGSLTSTDVMIADGATLNARDGSTITGLVTNYGTLDVGSSPGALTVIGDLFLGDTSYLPIEFTATAYDQIIVSGDVTLGGSIELIVLDGASFGTTELTIITAEGEITGTVDISSSGLLLRSDASVSDDGTGLTITTTVGLPSQSIAGLTTNQREIGDHLIRSLTGDVSNQDLVLLINGVGSITDEAALAAALDDLAPEGLDMGLKMITTSQGQFADLALDMAGQPAAMEDGKAVFWSAIDAFGVNQKDSVDYMGFDGNGTMLAFGVSGIDVGPVKLGVGLGFSNFTAGEDASFGGVVRGDAAGGRALHLNANLHADIPSELALGLVGRIDSSITYTSGENDLEMHTTDPVSGAVVTQLAEADIASLDWRTRFSVDGFGNATLPVTPYAVVGLTNYDQDALTIGGSTIVPINVEALENLRGLASVGVEYEHWLKKNLRVSADLSGTHYFGETQNEFSSRFDGAPTTQDNFLTFGKRVETQVALKTSVDYQHASGFVFSAGLRGEAGDVTMVGGSLRVSKDF